LVHLCRGSQRSFQVTARWFRRPGQVVFKHGLLALRLLDNSRQGFSISLLGGGQRAFHFTL
jgi:hypothetical protein